MGIKSVMNTDHLYWLGRYTERVYTTLRLFSLSFDTLIDKEEGRIGFCKSLEIPDIYPDRETFIDSYAFSLEDPNSIISNLYRAYDNAIELRQEIGSETLAFIQIAIYEMNAARRSEAPLLQFQKITDALLAFWGCVDDQIDDENTRNILKIGKRVERLDLYARLKKDKPSIVREVNRLTSRLGRTDRIYSKEKLQKLNELANAPKLDSWGIIRIVEQLVEC